MMSPLSRSDSVEFARLPDTLQQAVRAAGDKKAFDVVVLDLREVAAFADYFVICSGQTPRQTRAIADHIEETLRKGRVRLAHIEGYDRGGWILLDYFDFIVHVFTEETRLFYALERLWGSARRLALPDPERRADAGPVAP